MEMKPPLKAWLRPIYRRGDAGTEAMHERGYVAVKLPARADSDVLRDIVGRGNLIYWAGSNYYRVHRDHLPEIERRFGTLADRIVVRSMVDQA